MKKVKNFMPAFISGTIASDKRLGDRSKIIWGFLNNLSHEKGPAYVSNGKIALWLGGVTTRAVRLSLAELEKCGFIRRTVKRHVLGTKRTIAVTGGLQEIKYAPTGSGYDDEGEE